MSYVGKFFYPTFCTLRNRCRSQFNLKGDGGRDLIFTLFFIALELITFFGTKWILTSINKDPNLIFLSPAPPLSLFLLCLLVMMILAGLVTAYDSYFQSHDLELIFAAPIQGLQFFLGRLLLVILSVSWMPALLLLPVLAAFGVAYQAGWSFYLIAPIYFIPFFVLPGITSSIIAILFARFVPGDRSKLFFVVLLIVFVAMLFYLATIARDLVLGREGESQIVLLVKILSRGELPWLPSYWTAISIEQLLLNSHKDIKAFSSLSLVSSLFLFSTACFFYDRFYPAAFNNSRSRKVTLQKHLGISISQLSNWLPIARSYLRALIRKELLIFSREVTQTIQLTILSCLVILYIYNLPAFLSAAGDSSVIGIWYQRFTFMGNFSVGAFITIAACTRLVFPSLSLEGRSLWVLQTAPIDLSTVMRVKLWYWFAPVAILSLSLFCAGAWVVGVGFTVILCYAFTSLCIAYGVVGAACGLGAAYARFDWEHPSQLCAGFGSLMYMLYSCFLVTTTMIPTWYMLFNTSPGFLRGEPTWHDFVTIAANALIVFLINALGVKIAMHWGEKSLDRMKNLAS
jgi:ABC-2 type transport system permease protein